MSVLRRFLGNLLKKPTMSTSNGVAELTAGLEGLKIENDTREIPYEVATLALS